MKRLVVLFSLLSVLVASLAWAGDAHALGTDSDTQAVHHSQSNSDPHPSELGGCHVFHCQALVHLGSLPPASLPVLPALRRAAVPNAFPTNQRAGFLNTPWRPPSV